jgi:nucleotide-binding universal stress UspA family protein
MNAQVGDRTARESERRGDTAVVVPGAASGRAGTCVLAAIDDDGNPATILRYARAQASRLGVPLRVVHVWTGREDLAVGCGLPRRDRPVDADRLLSTVLYHHLPADEAQTAERQIVHDREPARALRALSGDAALIVMAATSNPAAGGGVLGDTARQLAGHTGCPLAILPPDAGR